MDPMTERYGLFGTYSGCGRYIEIIEKDQDKKEAES
jgi:hypothetical protein